MRSCTNGVFKRHGQIGRPCLLGYIGKCAAPCVGNVAAEEHREIVDDFCDFMAGRTAAFVKRIQQEMYAASEAEEFERAARLRDDLGALEKALEKQAVVLGDGTDADVVALAEDPLEVAVQIFYVRGGRVRGQRGWVADRVDEGDTPELVQDFLLQLYGAADDRRHDPARGAGAGAAARRRDPRGAAVRPAGEPGPDPGARSAATSAPSRRPSPATPPQALALHKTKRASDLTTRNRALEEIQQALELDEVPLRIECYDVSNLQGTEVVASMVVFEDGLARKSEYRRFVIRAVDGQNDVASHARGDHPALPAAARRAGPLERGRHRVRARCWSTPRPAGRASSPTRPGWSSSTAARPRWRRPATAMTELGIDDIPVCGLAKRLEEVWVPDEEDPVIFPRTSEGLYLLQRVRDEAHRFAITHHRSRRSKSMVESLLDDVPGLGEVRRKTLLKHFGSLQEAAGRHGRGDRAGPGHRRAHRHGDQGCGRRDRPARLSHGQHRHRRDRRRPDGAARPPASSSS